VSETLTMEEAAAAVGLAYETFRKVWPRLARERGFPPPFLDRIWDAAAVRAWRARRSEAKDFTAAEARYGISHNGRRKASPAIDYEAARASAMAQLTNSAVRR
jgi:hypothetical protein